MGEKGLPTPRICCAGRETPPREFFMRVTGCGYLPPEPEGTDETEETKGTNGTSKG